MNERMWKTVLFRSRKPLLDRFYEELKVYNEPESCPSFGEVCDLCNILNIIGRYAGFDEVEVDDFI